MSEDGRVDRRELRKEIVAAAGVIISLIAPLTSALGFSPLASIWSVLAIIIGFIFVVIAIYVHDKGQMLHSSKEYYTKYHSTRLSVLLFHPIYFLALCCLLLVSGAWLEANLGNTFNLLLYGGLSDLSVKMPSNVSEPATITLRRYGQNTCFFAQANFDLKNATSSGLYLGLLSATLDMQDNANAPILVPHNSGDIRNQNAFVSGIDIVTGPAEGWQAKLPKIKSELTFVRPGQTVGIIVRQEEWNQRNCVFDPTGDLLKTYKGSAVRITAGIAILRLDGSVERQDIRTGDIPAAIQRQ